MRKFLLLMSVAAAATLCNPARAQFCPGVSPWVFDDVQASDPFCGFITWMATEGITLGCQVIDANHRLYCPNDSVSRSQMAAFMNRLGNVRVEAVGTGPGLTGGPITSVGVIGLATTQLLPVIPCAPAQITRWTGSSWMCSNDSDSGGSVISVGTGTGLSGGPITISGTVSLLPGYQLPQGCTNGQVAKSNGSGGWVCASDTTGSGTVTSVTAGAGLTGGTITTSGTIAVDPASPTLTANFFRQGGNAFGATAVLGTTDVNAIDIRASGARVMRYEPHATSPNLLGGNPANLRYLNVRGATVAGGGTAQGFNDPDLGGGGPNVAAAHYAFVGGGFNNTAGSGFIDPASGALSSVVGGANNIASGVSSAVVGGVANQAQGSTSFVGGGVSNIASGARSAVPGGEGNAASGLYSTVPGGVFNVASGQTSLAWGSHSEATGDNSIALGYRARTYVGTTHADGAFVFADDSSGQPFGVAVSNRFAARATGGVLFVTAINLSGGATQSFFIAPSGDVTSTGDITAVAFHTTSDRHAKTAFAPVDTDAVLDAVLRLPIESWTYRSDARGARHIGPTAQDFRAAFAVGHDDRSIATVDADGVALAAIQGLNAKLEAKVAEQAREIERLHDDYRREVEALRRAVEALVAQAAPRR